MFIELIATLLAGLGGAGLIMIVNRMTGRRLPKWLIPVGAGVAMLAATISNEYGWFARTSASLPEGMDIVQTVESQAIYRPWTYAFPFVDRFVAVDHISIRTHPAQPGLRLGDTYFFGRWAPVNRVPVLADCEGSRRAMLADAIDFAEDGTISGVDWVEVATDDPVVRAMCGGA